MFKVVLEFNFLHLILLARKMFLFTITRMQRGRLRGARRIRETSVPPPQVNNESNTTVVPMPQEELLPGIPNEVTLVHITTKLPWRAFHSLSSVSHRWRQVIQSHEVHGWRHHSHSLETLAVLNQELQDGIQSAVSLYSTRDQRLYNIPPIPHLGGIPYKSECIALDGKLYVLGGLKDSTEQFASSEVYVLDLAGQQQQWRKCASMRQGRQKFGCGIMGGKIYVFGGVSADRIVYESEVYDPNVNVWSSCTPMPTFRFNHRVATVGGELVVYAGHVIHPELIHWLEYDEGGLNGAETVAIEDVAIEDMWDDFPRCIHVDVYDSAGDKWESCHSVQHGDWPIGLWVEERFFSVDWWSIYAGDDRHSPATHLHSLSSESSVQPDEEAPLVVLLIAAVVEGELLAVVYWNDQYHLVRTRGFCSENKDIIWLDAPFSSPTHTGLSLRHIMCTVQL